MPYAIAAIRDLMEHAFIDKELRRFCQEHSALEPVLVHLPSEASLADMTDILIDYCDKHSLFPDLLCAIEKVNPRQYVKYEPYESLPRRSAPAVEEDTEPRSGRKLLLEPVPSVPHFVPRKVFTAYQDRLRQERLVIVKGMAGVGKTALGAQLARAEAAREEQIFWFTFNAVDKNTTQTLFRALGAFLDLQGHPSLWKHLEGEINAEKPLEAQIKLNLLLSSLSSGDYILCFDDFHHVKDARDVVQFFEQILRQYQGRLKALPARFLIMGREIPQRMEYLVQEPLVGFSAEEARAFVKAGNLTLPPALLEQLWERTEGNPKLLQLGVAALATMAGNRAAMDRFIGAMARRGDLRDYLMAEIYSNLAPAEREVAGILSIFPTPLDREEVKRVLSAEGIKDVASHIDALINKSIISQTDDLRIHCHDLVREYCYDLLDDGDKKSYHQKAAAYYDQHGGYLAAAYHYFQRGGEEQALDTLTTHATAIIHDGDTAGLLELLARFQQSRLSPQQRGALFRAKGDAHEMRGEYEQAVAAYDGALQETREDSDRADLLCEIGTAYHKLGKYGLAVEQFAQSLAIGASRGDQARAARAHCNLGWACYRLGQLADARAHFMAGRELGQCLRRRDDGLPPGTTDALLLAKADLGLGSLDWREGDLEEARRRFEECRRVFKAMGDRRRESQAVGNLGLIYRVMGDSARERDCYRKALEIQKKMGDVYSLYTAYNNLADLYHRLGDHRQTVRYYGQLAKLAQDTGHRPWLSAARAGLADAYLAQGNPHQALEHAQGAQQIAQGIGPGVDLGVSCRVLGEVWLALGEWAQAKASLEQSIPLLRQANEIEELDKARRALERIRSRAGAAPSPGECEKEEG
jgi:tetratricopeptide (TPR) repeat protein